MSIKRYTFHEVTHCNMCGQEASSAEILGQRLNSSQGINPKSKIGISTSIVKCKKCSLIFANPQPVPFDIQDHYGIPPETYWKEDYFTYKPSYFKREVEIAKKLLPFEQGMKALDIGAGLGKGMISLEKAGFDTYGLEPSVPFHEKAIQKMKIPADRLKLSMLEETEYPANTFDFITFGAVLEHLYNPANSIEQALSWLKPNGIIQIEVPSSNWLIPKLYNIFYKLRGTNYTSNLSPMHEPFHLYEFGLKSFQELANRLPFEIAYHTTYVCSIYQIPRPLHPPLKWFMRKTNQGMQLAVYLRKV